MPSLDSIDIDIINSNWKEIVNKLDDKNSKLSSFIEESKPSEINNNKLILEIDNGNTFVKKVLETDKQIIIDTIKDVCGSMIDIQIVLNDSKEKIETKSIEKEHEKELKYTVYEIEKLTEGKLTKYILTKAIKAEELELKDEKLNRKDKRVQNRKSREQKQKENEERKKKFLEAQRLKEWEDKFDEEQKQKEQEELLKIEKLQRKEQRSKQLEEQQLNEELTSRLENFEIKQTKKN